MPQKKSTTPKDPNINPKIKKAKDFKLTETNATNLPEKVESTLEWEGKEVEVESETKLEADKGEGREIVLKFFDFQVIPQDFEKTTPTAQTLFNNHIRGIEMNLWKDGLTFETAIEPRLLLAKDKSHYRIVVGARYNRFKVLKEKPLTLHEIAQANRPANSV